MAGLSQSQSRQGRAGRRDGCRSHQPSPVPQLLPLSLPLPTPPRTPSLRVTTMTSLQERQHDQPPLTRPSCHPRRRRMARRWTGRHWRPPLLPWCHQRATALARRATCRVEWTTFCGVSSTAGTLRSPARPSQQPGTGRRPRTRLGTCSEQATAVAATQKGPVGEGMQGHDHGIRRNAKQVLLVTTAWGVGPRHTARRRDRTAAAGFISRAKPRRRSCGSAYPRWAMPTAKSSAPMLPSWSQSNTWRKWAHTNDSRRGQAARGAGGAHGHRLRPRAHTTGR